MKIATLPVRGILTEDGQIVRDEHEMGRMIAHAYQELRCMDENTKEDRRDEHLSEEMTERYMDQDIEEAIKECNFNKAIGPDGFDGKILEKDEEIKEKIVKEIRTALNRNEIGQHLKTARLVPLSKNKGSDIARVNEIRPIAVKSHLFKIMERAVENKLKESGSRLLKCDGY